MKLKKAGINDFLWETLCKFQNEKLFDSYNLVGGTALSLLIEHRISTDIDLFTEEKLNKEEIFNFAKKINRKAEILNSSGVIFQIFLPNSNPEKTLKMDFVNYEYPLIEPLVKNDDNIRLIGKNDISAMKISAVGTRGYEARDFIDMYYLLKDIPIETMINNFKLKYSTENIQHYLRSLNYFDDVSMESWESVKMIHDKLSVNAVKKTINKEVNKYWKKFIG
ncbi:MAG: nucleotidyl transferase AbiEii/AbiGii toxin family protein [Treponema sp.]|nr:nucleotidyl transferase AbiEii/AbiGii toxin family protein [Treponema sp.]